MASKQRINVPKELGDEVVVRWDGNDPTTYRVNDGHVLVEPEYVDRFLSVFDDAKLDVGTSGTK